MGAVVGALYASGYTSRELDSLAREVPLLFAPELRDGQYLADGGLSANTPVAAGLSWRAAGELYVGARRNFQLGRQLLNPVATVRIVDEEVRRFEPEADELNEAKTREAIGFLGAERRLPHGW